MTELAERYDQVAEGYARWWAPVIAPRARDLLDRLDADVDGREARILDVGTGTGTLVRAALERWPRVRLDAIDASEEMTTAARRAVMAVPGGAERTRIVTAMADELPYAEGTFDAAMSSFVLQLVPNRFQALREIWRVLRPGGRFAYVTWVSESRRWRPDDILDDLLDELGIDGRVDDDDDDPALAGNLPSADAAATGMRRAGFRGVRAEGARLRHRFDPESYTNFITEFDEQTLVHSLEPGLRARLIGELQQRLRRLDPDELVLDTPIAYATGHKPEG